MSRTTKRRGRPKGTKNVKTIVRSIAQERHKVKEGDQTRRLTTVELLFRLVMAEAMKGDLRAEKWLDRFLARQNPPSENLGYILVPEPCSKEELLKRMHIRNALRKQPTGE